MLDREFIYAPTTTEGFREASAVLNVFDGTNLQTLPDPLRLVVQNNEVVDLHELPKEYAMVMAARTFGALCIAHSVTETVENPYYLSELARSTVLEHESMYDTVTGYLNRRGLLKWAEENYKPENNTYGVVAVDLADFKSINDSLGHFKGDDALKAACDYIASQIRVRSSDEPLETEKRMHNTSDIICVARFGGDEIFFVMNFNGIEQSLAAKAMERVATGLDTTELTMSCDNDVLNQKFGFRTGAVLTGPHNPLTFDEAIHIADRLERDKRTVQKAGHAYVNAAHASTIQCSTCPKIDSCFSKPSH